MSTIEVVCLAPLVIGFVLLLVCFGLLVDARGTVQGAARDAAREASLQRSNSSAIQAATAEADTDLGSTCSSRTVSGTDTTTPGAFAPGDLYTVTVSCTVSLSGVDWFDIGSQTITASSTAPLDLFRRSG